MWILLALLATVSASARNIFTKKAVDQVHEVVAVWSMLLVATVMATIYILFTGITITSQVFFLVLGARVFIDTFAIIANFRAMKFEEVSFVVPLIALMPITTGITSFLLNGQLPTYRSLIGMAVILIGTSILFASKIEWSSFQANRNVLKATGYMLATIAGWSIAEALHKQGINHSSPSTYFWASYVGFTMVFTVLSWFVAKNDMRRVFSREFRVTQIGNGVTMGFDRIFSLNAITTGLVVYVNSLKSTSVVVTAIMAWIWLKEDISSLQWAGIGISFFGVLLTILAQ